MIPRPQNPARGSGHTPSGAECSALSCVDQPLIDDLPYLGVDGIHLLRPGHPVRGLQFLGDAGGIYELISQNIMTLDSGVFDLLQVNSQSAGEEHQGTKICKEQPWCSQRY